MGDLFKTNASATNPKVVADPNPRDQTTKAIALTLLYTFIASVVFLFVINIAIKSILSDGTNTAENTSDLEFRKGWFELLKNSLILLGTALTTVIGYYFGQREGSIKASEAERKAEETDQTANTLINDLNQQRNEVIKSVTKASDSANPSSPPINESNSSIEPPV